jgi:ATP-dependent DNA ligase
MIGVPKPKKDLPPDVRNKSIYVQRKWNGCCVFGVTPNELFSRRTSKITGAKIPYDGKLPQVAEELNRLPLPPNSVPQGEMIWIDPKTGLEDFRTLQRITGSGDANAIELQKELGSPTWIIFNLLFLNSAPLYRLTYEKRYEALQKVFEEAGDLKHIRLIENLDLSIDDAYELAKASGWEGLVIKDREGTDLVEFNDADNFSPRPPSTWKMVVTQEVEAIALGFDHGTGMNSKRVGHLWLYMYNRKGKLKSIGKVGIFEGYRQDFRDELAARENSFNGKFYEFKEPFVCKVRYSSWTDKRKLFHPKFFAITDDKSPEECILEDEFRSVVL